MRGTRLGTRDSGFGSRSRGFAILAPILLVMLLPSCRPQTVPQAEEPFPRSGEVAGWTKARETRTFRADNLWEYIDGDAERYLQAGVEQAFTADYRYQDKTDVVADIFIMRTAEGPRKLLESEWSPEAKRVAIGDDARLYAASLVFRKDRYLVRIIAYEEPPEIGKALLAFGQAIERRIAERK